MTKQTINILVFSVITMIIIGCNNDTDDPVIVTDDRTEEEIILDYLEDKNITATRIDVDHIDSTPDVESKDTILVVDTVYNGEEIEAGTKFTWYDTTMTYDTISSFLYYKIDVPGNGTFMDFESQQRAKLFYKGYFANGSVFDLTDNTPYDANLLNVVLGWRYGIPLFDHGAIGSLYIPSPLGYGESGSGSIPGNTPIFFDIEMLMAYK